MSVTDLPIGPGPYPESQYDAAESDGIYCEDRELNGATYRTYNARFDGSEWSLVDSTRPAFATVQSKADGSIAYSTKAAGSPPWSVAEGWDGGGNNAVFNAADYGMSPPASASENLTALSAVLIAARNAGGGIVFIPAGAYRIAGTINLSTDPPYNFPDVRIIVVGAGGTTELVQQEAVNTFSVEGFGSGGLRFQDIHIQYKPGLDDGVAISADSRQNVACNHLLFTDCPQALYSGDGAVQCEMLDCTIDDADAHNVGDGTMVSLARSEAFIDHCDIREKPLGEEGPSGCLGIQIGSISTTYIRNTYISHSGTGIYIEGDADSQAMGCDPSS